MTSPAWFGKSLQCWNCAEYEEWGHRCTKFDIFIKEPIESVCGDHTRFHGERTRLDPNSDIRGGVQSTQKWKGPKTLRGKGSRRTGGKLQ